MMSKRALAFCLVFAHSIAAAAAPALIPIQGYLTDSSDIALDGNQSIEFFIYGQATGGTALFQETHTVTVNGGHFVAYLGEVDTLDLSIFDGNDDLFLAFKVGTEPELAPRIQLGAVPFAGFAQYCGDAATLAGAASTDYATQAAFTTLSNQLTALQAQVTALEAAAVTSTSLTTTLTDYVTDTELTAANYLTSSDLSDYATTATVTGINTRVGNLETKTADMSISGDDVRFTGVNLVIRNGTGTTAGAVNGTGNLIVGYNETRTTSSTKTGSHNVVVGPGHNYSSFAGIVNGYACTGCQGEGNAITAPGTAVIGGVRSTAGNNGAVVLGGRSNQALGDTSVALGGGNNEVYGAPGTVIGGIGNVCYGNYTVMLGEGFFTTPGDGTPQVNQGCFIADQCTNLAPP